MCAMPARRRKLSLRRVPLTDMTCSIIVVSREPSFSRREPILTFKQPDGAIVRLYLGDVVKVADEVGNMVVESNVTEKGLKFEWVY